MLKSPDAFGKGACQRMPHAMCPAGSSLLQPRACSSGGSQAMCGARPWPGEVEAPRMPGDVAVTVPRGCNASVSPAPPRQAPSCARLLVPRFVPGQLSQVLPNAPQILSP